MISSPIGIHRTSPPSGFIGSCCLICSFLDLCFPFVLFLCRSLFVFLILFFCSHYTTVCLLQLLITHLIYSDFIYSIYIWHLKSLYFVLHTKNRTKAYKSNCVASWNGYKIYIVFCQFTRNAVLVLVLVIIQFSFN